MAAKVTFDPANKRIICKAGVTSLDARIDLYSDAKEDWKLDPELNKFRFPFEVVGGDPIDEGEGVYVTSYFFLKTGWRVRPQEANHTLKVSGGVLLTLEGADPFVPTLGMFNVQVKYSQPIKSETISTGGGSGGLTSEEHDQLMATSFEVTAQEIKERTINLPDNPANETTSTIIKAQTDKIQFADNNDIKATLDSEPVTLVDADIVKMMGEFAEGNVRRQLVPATTINMVRNVAIGVLDHIIYEIKRDADPDWSAPISKKTLYCWYANMGDIHPIRVGE